MTHLLDRIAAFVDDELDNAERDRVLVHLASCDDCRAEVAAERELKNRLGALSTPEPSADLMAAILRLAEPGEPLPPPIQARRDKTTRPRTVGVGHAPPTRPVDRRRDRSRRRVRVLGSTALLSVAAMLVTAFAVGGEPSNAPALTPDLDSYLVEHASTSRDVPFAEVPTDVVGVSLRARGHIATGGVR